MDNNEPKNCWEFWNCPEDARKACEAYKTQSGHECWLVAYVSCPKRKRDYKYCWECDWFKKLNPNFK